MNRYPRVPVTEFVYDGPVSESYNEVRLRPMHDDRQSCLSFRVITAPPSNGCSYEDTYGNSVYEFNVLREHQRLKIEAESLLLAYDLPEPPLESPRLAELDSMNGDLSEEYFEFLAPTAYVPHLPQIRELMEAAEGMSGGQIIGFVQSLSDLIHNRFQYLPGATHVHSSIADCLSIRAGFCQDFAHVLLGGARMRGLPARYVSGYLVPARTASAESKQQAVIGGQASHAWAEVLIPAFSC